MLVNELEDLKKSHRISHEICQRFVRLSCQKMVTSRGSANLRRNLLILQLLQRARRNLKEVPNECRALLDLNQPLQPPSFRNRSGTPRPSSPMSRRMGRSFQSQQTTPFRRPTINTSALADEKPSIAQQPISPPPVDAIKSSTILACKALDDEVFVSEKENKKLEDVEELFLAKVVLPSRPKPVQKAAEVREVVKQPLKSHRLEFPLPIRNINGRRDFFGIALPEIKPPPSTEIRPLSDTFTGKIESAPLHNVKSGFEVEEMPPCLFKCDEPKAEVKKSTEKSDRVVPRMTRNSVSLCLDSNDLKALDSEEEDCCQTDGDFESDSEQDGDFGYHRSSFKRRLRKRKTKGGMNSNIFTSEKRSKDSGLMLVDMELNHRKHQEDHCVPCISI